MIFFLAATLLSFLLTLVVRMIAQKFSIFDHPDRDRKLHKNPTPLLGGTAIFLAFWIIIFYLYNFTNIVFNHFSLRQLVLIFIASSILMVMGYFDDKYVLKYHWRLGVSIIAVLLVLAGGINFDGITNPFGGTVGLDFFKIHTQIFGTILVGANIIAFLWLLGMIYTVKILDGLDGLATGVSTIGALSMAALAGGTTRFFQPDVAVVALTLAGACVGFLILNFHPAKIFLGEGGGQFLGLMLGTLAIVAGSKIGIALLVMALPIIDLLWVMGQRIFGGQSVAVGDRRHLHFRLLDGGLNHRAAVCLFYVISALFGFSALFMSSGFKLATLLLLIIAIICLEIFVSKKSYAKR